MPDQVARNEKQLGAILRRARKLEGLSQGDLGERTSLRQATISRLETGAPAIQLRTVMDVLCGLKLELVVRPRVRGESGDDKSVFW